MRSPSLSRSRLLEALTLAVAIAALALASPHARAKVVHAIEFHHAVDDRYHVTSVAEEIEKLDNGTIPGWQRTGHFLRAHSTPVNGTNPVCRFYLPAAHGNSHFLSASPVECARVRAAFPEFIHESRAVMHMALPDTTTGGCGASAEPVYRLWNHKTDTHHRYTSDVATRNTLVQQGWVPEGYGPDAVALCQSKDDTEPNPVTAALPPPCKGPDSRVAVPGAPHGMYVWNPNAFMLKFLEQAVIGIDPTLCGASLVIPWSSVNPSNGVYDWTAVTTAAQPFVSAGLTVNLLFSEASESATSNTVTPAWVFQPVASGGAGAASVTCETYPQFPVYFDPAYEKAWTTFIAAAITQFSFGNSALSANVGYLRFATGGGAEALIPPGLNDGGACQTAWTTAGFTYAAWNAHEARIITAMGSVSTDKQIMVSLGQAPGGPNVYDVSNQAAAVALSKNVGFSFENLGMGNVATAGTTPEPCSTTATLAVLHWCQAYTSDVGKVPFAAQPITATTNTSQATMDIGVLLGYALVNNIQILELYPEEWLSANASCWPAFVPANQAKYQQALQNASQTLGGTGITPPPVTLPCTVSGS